MRLEQLYRSSRDDVFAYVCTLLRDPSAAEDVTALAFERAYRRRRAVRVALETMAPRDRELIALKFHGGLKNSELATVLGVSESNAGTMLHRAIEKLRKACNETA